MKKKNLLKIICLLCILWTLVGCNAGTNKNTESVSGVSSPQIEKTSDDLDLIGMPNPWTDTDKNGVSQATGFNMEAPDNATNVSYSYINDSKLAQMTYELDDIKWTYRIEKTSELVDISGMYYIWTGEEKDTLAGFDATYYSYMAEDKQNEDDVQLVNWYDNGATHSLSAVAKDLDGMDIQAYAERLLEKNK